MFHLSDETAGVPDDESSSNSSLQINSFPKEYVGDWLKGLFPRLEFTFCLTLPDKYESLKSDLDPPHEINIKKAMKNVFK